MTCLSQTLPTFSDIAAGFGISSFSLPSLPTFPKPFFGSTNAPGISTPHWTVDLQNIFYGGLVLGLLQYVCKALGINYLTLIPAIAGLSGVTIMDFINGSYVKIKAAIKSAGSAFTSLFPVPLFGAVSSPDIETSHKIQFTFSQAIKSVIDIIISKISSITNFISDTFHATIASVTFPTFPTIAAMTAAISAAFSAGSSSVSFSGFPSITIPSFGEIFSPVIQAVKALPMMFVDLMIGMLKPIVTFINDIASFFGSFTWPKLCINSNGYYAG